ncbi:alpha/beta fold hydrolase [Bdellovibrio sp. HCB288]|uniref:alpha/beta fold hydrolase n=1 Tax=Bdellovibrio sp. HCB288 TaxID=3394355 RepID=UPI0039B3DE3F
MKNLENSKTLKAKTQYAEINESKKIAYRTFGEGSPIILANRFRGDLDSWDPAFLDFLAEKHQVVIFQYSGTGSSTGAQAKTNMEMAQDIIDIADYLKIDKFSVGGWSQGGFAAQIVITEFPERIHHGILIGTRVPGKESSPIKDIFFEHALKPENDLHDEVVLFFNPQYPVSVKAAEESHDRLAMRKSDRSLPITPDQYKQMVQVTGFREDTYGTFEKMKNTNVPVLSIVGEDDICFPAEDWFAMKGKLPTVQVLLLPSSGHGPQHQYPELSASYINQFIDLN